MVPQLNAFRLLASAALLTSLVLGGCAAGEGDPYANAPKSDVPGPGKEGMDQWSAQNPDNGKPGHDEPADPNGVK